MSSLWDGYAQKIYSGNISIKDITDLIEFLRDFDKVNKNVISELVSHQLSFIKYDFVDWDMFEAHMRTGSVHRRVLEYFIGALHDFDHANEQVLMYTFNTNKSYWKKHKSYKNWMGTFKDGVWVYSKKWREIHTEVEGKNVR